jgi:hypothetical protein
MTTLIAFIASSTADGGLELTPIALELERSAIFRSGKNGESRLFANPRLRRFGVVGKSKLLKLLRVGSPCAPTIDPVSFFSFSP